LDRRFAVGSKLHVLSNGYDPEELANVEPFDFGHFAIVYAGNFYPPKRVVTPIMAALKGIARTNGLDRDWFFHYYGRQERHVLEQADLFGIRNKVITHGWVPQSQALSAIRGAGLTIVISSVNDKASVEERGIMTGKVYEALGLKTPVLMIAPAGSDLEVIAQKHSTARCFVGSNIDEMTRFIIDLIEGRVCNSDVEDEFAWPNIARRLDIILRTAIVPETLTRTLAESAQPI
jgi:glycosyltransferase involved in cell wall biosynthesis